MLLKYPHQFSREQGGENRAFPDAFETVEKNKGKNDGTQQKRCVQRAFHGMERKAPELFCDREGKTLQGQRDKICLNIEREPEPQKNYAQNHDGKIGQVTAWLYVLRKPAGELDKPAEKKRERYLKE